MKAARAEQLRLVDLANLDTRIAQLRFAKANHPTLARIAELEGQVADLHGSLVDSRTAVTDLTRELRKAESDVEQVVARQAKNQERLDSGAVGAKDALALTDELAALAKRQSALEEVQFEVMERLEAHQKSLAEVEAAHQALLDAKSEVEAERDAAFAEINEQGRALVTERAATAKGTDAALVREYEAIKARIGSAGAAILRAGKCSGCGMHLNPTDLDALLNAPEDQVNHCEECDRILISLGDSAA